MNTNPPESDDPICEECDMPMHQWALDGVSGWACSGCGWSLGKTDADNGSTIEPVEIPITFKPDHRLCLQEDYKSQPQKVNIHAQMDPNA